ncbi:MAG: proline--tRNA ligase [Balneola sp.]|jgi:prolyl-tRNA synthetase|nr:proline--tRNA ligase [Balneola sp.]MBE78233.1 proline--tRNA ligase [Balneola sp.]HBX66257.1 proline--tRNA ligase [Balneolaceae bacterium]|tara:strand:- start:2185 stop:3651 length:1467 start_codon:yes stop_codon:yes gene_type:complete
MAQKITSQEKDYSQWYLDVIREAKLAEHSPVRGSMVIRPNGMALWENMRDALDTMFKDTGHENAYFPLFIPKSFLSKEAQHVEGFAKECAVVTHSRLKSVDGGVEVDPDSKLEEELIVRPTSETIIWDTYRGWIQSYRDLPLLINQWANVVRWEMRTRLFLRTMEFLWQEGHTAHATQEEAEAETRQMLDVYATFAEEFMAMPVIKGVKTASERFAGAVETYCIEALMQDGKALQAGTSHFLGQNFAKAFDVKFQDKDGEHKLVWATSWGVSTRLIGGLIMTHSDDQGLVLPPKLAPTQVVIVPIYRSDEQREAVLEYADGIYDELKKLGVRIKVDDRDNQNPGYKFAEHEAAGIPLRIAVGPRDLENNNVELARRDTKEKNIESREGLSERIQKLLTDIQDELFNKAKTRREEMTSEVDSYDEFQRVIENKGGFVWAHWDGTPETEEKIKNETKATVRLIPLEDGEAGECMVTGKLSKQKVLFARSY